jgi:DNA-binding NtrC family response regulator
LQHQASARFGGEEKYRIRGYGIVSNKRILVIEDEFLIGLEIHALLTEAGFGVVGPAATVPAALKHISEGNFDAALVDANLGGDSVEGVTAALANRGTPFVLVTGYSRKTLPPQLANAPLIQKPFDPPTVIDAVQRLF